MSKQEILRSAIHYISVLHFLLGPDVFFVDCEPFLPPQAFTPE